MPDLIDEKIQVSIFVDADHAHCQVTRRSVTAILVFLNSTPVRWYSKMQKTVETSTYGSELVAARIATDIAIELRHDIRMMGHQLDGPVNMYGDNQAVVLNTTVPSSMLKKKHAACAYHRVREAIASKILTFIHIPTQFNVSDVLSKPLAGTMHHRLIAPILYGDGVPLIFKHGPDGQNEDKINENDVVSNIARFDPMDYKASMDLLPRQLTMKRIKKENHEERVKRPDPV